MHIYSFSHKSQTLFESGMQLCKGLEGRRNCRQHFKTWPCFWGFPTILYQGMHWISQIFSWFHAQVVCEASRKSRAEIWTLPIWAHLSVEFLWEGEKSHILKGKEKIIKKEAAEVLGLVLFKTWQLFESCLQIQNVRSWYWELQPGVNRKRGMDLMTADVAVRADGELRALAWM